MKDNDIINATIARKITAKTMTPTAYESRFAVQCHVASSCCNFFSSCSKTKRISYCFCIVQTVLWLFVAVTDDVAADDDNDHKCNRSKNGRQYWKMSTAKKDVLATATTTTTIIKQLGNKGVC